MDLKRGAAGSTSGQWLIHSPRSPRAPNAGKCASSSSVAAGQGGCATGRMKRISCAIRELESEALDPLDCRASLIIADMCTCPVAKEDFTGLPVAILSRHDERIHPLVVLCCNVCPKLQQYAAGICVPFNSGNVKRCRGINRSSIDVAAPLNQYA